MAGPAQRGSRARERSSRGASSSGAAASTSVVTARRTGRSSPARAIARAIDPARRSSDALLTGTTYRQLLLRGLAPAEAADLTAFLCGLPVAQVHWSLRQVNQLLFLRELARTGRFGPRDGVAPRPH